MAECEGNIEGDEDEITPGYKAPAQVDLQTIKQLDADDESLVKYKEALLGQTDDVKDEGGENVLVKKLIIYRDGASDVEIDLTGDLKKIEPVTLKEGSTYTLGILFRVQREIVSGLRFSNNVYRKGIRVEKNNRMVGSYGPKDEAYLYKGKAEETPKGMLSRGPYVAKSKFLHDDVADKPILAWEWNFEIKKEWKKE